MEAASSTFYRGFDYDRRKSATITTRRLLTVILMAALCFLRVNAQSKFPHTEIVSSDIAARIDFKVNLTEVDASYHNNDSELELVLSRIDSMVLNPRMKVKRIIVVGTASPEGPYRNNVRLASDRAKTFIKILQLRYSFPDSLYSISTIPEDWDGLRLMLKEDSAIPHSDTVLEFLYQTESLRPDVREYRLKHLDNGAPYRSMLDNVLPYLRRASVIVRYDTEWIKQRRIVTPVLLPALPINISQTAPDNISVIYPDAKPEYRFFAIKTNALGDMVLCANLGVEVELWPHWSLDIPLWYSPYDITARWRIRLLATQPEVRYWLKDAGMGHYFGVHTSIVGFNVSMNGDFRYQDPNHAAFGVGISYGYAFHLDKAQRWGMELNTGAGYIGYKWIKYHNTGRNGAEVSRGSGTYWGITRLGVTLSYKFYRNRKGRRWMEW